MGESENRVAATAVDHAGTARLAAIFFLTLLLLTTNVHAATVISPDGRIRVDVMVSDDGQPQYAVNYRNSAVVAPSKLGLRFASHHALADGFGIAGSDYHTSDNTWEQPWGERRLVRAAYNERSVRFRSRAGPDREFTLVVRAFNDGIGFRYVVPEQPYFNDVVIVDELTEFRVPPDATAWWIPGRGWNRYEFLYRETPVADIALAHTPVTLRLANGVHLSLHEAALVDYPAYVIDQRRDGVLKTSLTPWSGGERARVSAPFVSPWRTIQVAPDASGLLNSSLILNLNEPNKLGDVSWVEPGKYVGIWWAMHLGERTWGSGAAHGATTAETKRYIDFAAANGFDGVLVEGWNTGWDGDWFSNGALFSFTEAYPDFDLADVAAYAREKGVRIVGHHETSGHISNYEAQMDAAFDLYESLGVRQVKTGYVADGGDLRWVDDAGVMHHEWHDGQYAVNHFERVLIAAAKRGISINTHEPVKDTGLRRTYPNWISREGARGQEYNASWSAPNPPSHNVTLPYTRLLAGPMDFTPGIFDLAHQGAESGYRVQSTLMQQLALYVAFYSPIQMAADLPENYAKFPDAFRFIRDVPADWEQSIALAGEVGDFVVFARQQRGGDDWFIGALSGDDARSLSIALEFLDGDRRYRATIYRDGDDAHWRTNPYDYVIDTQTVTQASVLDLSLAAGGGAAIRLSPISNQ